MFDKKYEKHPITKTNERVGNHFWRVAIKPGSSRNWKHKKYIDIGPCCAILYFLLNGKYPPQAQINTDDITPKEFVPEHMYPSVFTILSTGMCHNGIWKQCGYSTCAQLIAVVDQALGVVVSKPGKKLGDPVSNLERTVSRAALIDFHTIIKPVLERDLAKEYENTTVQIRGRKYNKDGSARFRVLLENGNHSVDIQVKVCYQLDRKAFKVMLELSEHDQTERTETCYLQSTLSSKKTHENIVQFFSNFISRDDDSSDSWDESEDSGVEEACEWDEEEEDFSYRSQTDMMSSSIMEEQRVIVRCTGNTVRMWV
eukprot:GILJ01002271.1.p1 GENE.GILJ01002271.1~~GILJ01002271.1.p1  ORF type:complete len:313 (-),score=19.70 GILJ01002271.1:85-1023(-)